MHTLKLVVCLLVVLAVPWPAGAAIVPHVDLAAQVDQADLIFVGTVTSAEAVPTGDGNFAFTYVTFAVDEAIKGTTRGPVVTLRLAGGDVGANAFQVGGAPAFAVGGKHLLFVEGNDRLGVPLVGWYWGKIDVVADPVSQRPILLDHTRRSVDGIQGNDWKRGPLALGADGTPPAPQITVVSEQGVKIVLDDASTKPVAAEAAATVLAQLRAFVASRRATSSAYRQPPVFESASKSNVPATFVFHAVPAPGK